MEIIADTTDFFLTRETAVAIGKFDGIHIGHRRLLNEIGAGKKKELSACVFTFDPPPSVVFGTGDGRELTTRQEKRALFERMGVDILIEYPLNKESAAVSPEFFVRDILARRMNARLIAAGEDVSFGDKGLGNAKLLESMAKECCFEVKLIDKVKLDDCEISSTLVRKQIELGNMPLAEKLLGMPYTIMGRVEHGKRLGRTIGMPTINVLPPASKLLPPNGVYYSSVLYNGRRYRSISNVGYKPTVSSERVLGVESYLYDFHEEIYGAPVEVSLYAFKRPEQKFSGIEELKAQMGRDIAEGAVWKRAE